MKKIHIYIATCLIGIISFSACSSFLDEDPKTFLSPSNYYKNEKQVRAAVNGTYDGLSRMLGSDIEIATVRLFNLEYIVGHCYRPRTAGHQENQFLLLSGVEDSNTILREMWRTLYYPLENCNSVIVNVEASGVIASEEAKQRYLGEVYFLRAYYYYFGVQLFGDIPLKTVPSLDAKNTQIEKSSTEDIYTQILSDLEKAEASGLPWTNKDGYVSMGAVKTLKSKVYLTMAGYPLLKGKEYYQKAYETSKEVISSTKFGLFNSYAELRASANENAGEHIFMLQREEQNASSPLHFGLMPYPEQPISINPSWGGGLAPLQEFYDSYSDADMRKQEGAFFYTKHAEYGNESNIIDLKKPYLCKYWDDGAEKTSKSGANLPLYRYADVLLMCAEAKAAYDGGTTSDATALDAYWLVRKRAFPNESKPTSITSDEVLKERFWELSFEFHNWFDMQRTRKAFDPVSGSIVNLIGYQAPNHKNAFKESDLIFPIPLREKELNPLLSK